ncbi:hypothetical protein [Siphonobacter sp. SORGH_AS_1065]|uniref:hypothetical protein n=1 Tax=Siphonobacter sp. SORGH_AS_1065 TaxID=3041795 RepID=UPI002789CF61|nr:hypothetical protein [Siphonobacter sp. SORGH_AS_1065]MDQ1089970.1 hypothetical protein [Siphonobacter sp. SORGH_AS_1065]
MSITLRIVFLGLLAHISYSQPSVTVTRSFTTDSLGACQGVSCLNEKVYLYGDREVGMIREYDWIDDSLRYTNREVRLTEEGKDVINHPTGIAYQPNLPVFIGNSIRLNKEGTIWKAVIYAIDWEGLWKTGTLDGNLIRTIEDDACIQGTRPQYVEYQGNWVVATADYGSKNNKVRLYDPERLKNASKTSEPGVVLKKFKCSPLVQNLHWIPEKRQLVLIQNQTEGRKWRLTFLDFDRSVEQGSEVVLKVIDFNNADELEGFSILSQKNKGLIVTSSKALNTHMVALE